MHTALSRLRATIRPSRESEAEARSDAATCSWDAMHETYQEQAARGIPEAIQGLELIEQGRWPTSGRRRDGAGAADG